MFRVLTVLAMALGAALPTPAGDDVGVLSARLRDPKLALEERDQIRERLLGLGDEGVRVLQRHLEERSDRLDERATKHERRYLAGVERRARKTIDARLTRARMVEIETLRKEIAKLRADATSVRLDLAGLNFAGASRSQSSGSRPGPSSRASSETGVRARPGARRRCPGTPRVWRPTASRGSHPLGIPIRRVPRHRGLRGAAGRDPLDAVAADPAVAPLDARCLLRVGA